MKHFGDITKLDGASLPVVDIIVGGSPCQDLSVAGKRGGLSAERSGLFMEQIRIIKEMRNADRERTGRPDQSLRPRIMLWENVVGALSVNGGDDFHAVLEETARIADSNADVPRLPDGQNWSNSGVIMGDRWSIAWRVHDAQFWGVPQRRRRISLVADFGGQSAPEILFERKGLSGNSEPSKQERESLAADVGRGAKTTNYTLKIRGGCEVDSSGKKAGKGALIQEDKSATLGTSQDQTLFENVPCYSQMQYDKFSEGETASTLKASGGSYGGGSELLVIQSTPCVQATSKESETNTSTTTRWS